MILNIPVAEFVVEKDSESVPQLGNYLAGMCPKITGINTYTYFHHYMFVHTCISSCIADFCLNPNLYLMVIYNPCLLVIKYTENLRQ